MKFWPLFIFLAFGLFINCTEEVPFTYTMTGFTENSIDSCKTIGCPKISLNFADMQGNSEVTEKMNSTIKDYVISALNIGNDGEAIAKTVPDAVKNFINVYRMDSADFPDMSAEYFAEVTVLPSSITKKLISLSMSEYLYTGGAHGHQNIHFINFNPENGVELSVEELFEDIEKFIPYAEKKFREAHGISENESINATGFLFEDDVFYLPETIGFLDGNLVLIYNPYEIASYADGPIKLDIPLSEANEYLRFK